MQARAGKNKTGQQSENGIVRLTRAGLREFFDLQARKNVKMSGRAALRRIRAGRAGSNLAWAELSLLSSLVRD